MIAGCDKVSPSIARKLDGEQPQILAICSTFANEIEPLLICCDNADWVIPNFSATDEMVCP